MASAAPGGAVVCGVRPVRRGHHDPVRARPLRRAAAGRSASTRNGGSSPESTRESFLHAPRDERWADGLTKTHINDDPAQYYDYALSYALLFQLHDHIARQILHQDPHDTDYYGSREVGDFLRRLMAPGATPPMA